MLFLLVEACFFLKKYQLKKMMNHDNTTWWNIAAHYFIFLTPCDWFSNLKDENFDQTAISLIKYESNLPDITSHSVSQKTYYTILYNFG